MNRNIGPYIDELVAELERVEKAIGGPFNFLD
jgi:hypothetical protein